MPLTTRSSTGLILLGTLTGLVLGAAVLFGAGPVLAQTDPPAPEVQIEVRNFNYDPLSITIVAGTRVVWTNFDDAGHTATERATPRTFDASLSPGQSDSVVFTTPGRYRYFCSPHPGMPTGTITVIEDPTIWRGQLFLPSLVK